jgi:spermidine synthase
MPSRDVRSLLALFALSGFTGLIYESVWSHYLRLFLGSAAFAQSFVLVAFMGGLALGALIASRWIARLKNALAAYGWIEAAIGAAALVFHEAYVQLTQASLDHVIPALGSPGAVDLWKYALCTVLIVPQTTLLGMTFPLLSAAVIRRGPETGGQSLAMLYFTNSIGAAAGALAAAFWLLEWVGMPGTMRLAGVANLALAAAVLAIARRGEPVPPAPAPPGRSPLPGIPIARLFLAAAFVTGLASFVYEIVWIRMLALVLGSSFHAFELMLSAFITGLALGSLWIRRRIERISDPARFAGLVQLAMGLAALATVFVYHETFDWMAWALSVLQRNSASYTLFNLFSHALSFAVMLPATFLAGMTLPLFTHALLRSGSGERAIGQVYAWNTLGAIAGVLVTVHWLIPGMGLKLALVLGACADILLGAWLLRRSQAASRRGQAFAAVIVGMLAATATARADVLKPERLASGVYRYGVAALEDRKVFFYRDGKTASVAVRDGSQGRLAIVTNGKPDAAIEMDPRQPPSEDEYTMTLLGALPLLIEPGAKSFANIGFGSGLTMEVLLSHGGPREVDTIEIEPAMVAGARSFFPRNSRAYRDPRGRVYFEDAKSYFARSGKRYDVIVSEPSNPWVNGVASLFTTEFYRDAKRYLAPGGLFVQWLHLYELNDRLLGSMLGALGENFADYEVYAANSADLVVVAVARGRVPSPRALPWDEKAFMDHLERLGITRVEQVGARSLGTKRVIAPLLAPLGAPVNSDYRPFVQLEAPAARFRSSIASAVNELAEAPLPVLEMAGGMDAAYLRDPATAVDAAVPVFTQSVAIELARGLLDRSIDPLRADNERVRTALLTLKQPGALCGREPQGAAIEQLHWAASATLAHLAPGLRRALWVERKWIGCAPGRLSPEVLERLDLYAAIAARDAGAMLRRARALLAGPALGGNDWGRFLLVTAMLGAHATGDHDEAQRLWTTYGGLLYPGGAMPLYVAYVANLS